MAVVQDTDEPLSLWLSFSTSCHVDGDDQSSEDLQAGAPQSLSNVLQPFRLLDLPTEIRLRILTIALRDAELPKLRTLTKSTSCPCQARVISSCKKLQAECRPVFEQMFYAETTFVLRLRWPESFNRLRIMRRPLQHLRLGGYPWPDSLSHFTSLKTLELRYRLESDMTLGRTAYEDRCIVGYLVMMHMELIIAEHMTALSSCGEYIQALYGFLPTTCQVQVLVFTEFMAFQHTMKPTGIVSSAACRVAIYVRELNIFIV